MEKVNQSKNKLNKKAIALLSGGLDSRLAVKIMQEQGIELICLNMVTAFCTCTSKDSSCSEAKKAAQEFGLSIRVKNNTMALLEAVRDPKYGYGKNLNPCIDCRLLMFEEAKKLMEKEGASFIVTGEVLGSRPMSQRMKAIELIENKSGLNGLILRPLSAKLFNPTLIEEEGIVDRDKLLSIEGRSRKEQIKLANEKEIDYPCPAGGCLLTDNSFSKRLKKLLDNNPKITLKQLNLLKYGRHFYIKDHQVIVGRDDQENKMIKKLGSKDDIFVEVKDYLGPLTLICGNDTKDYVIKKAAVLTARYGQGREEDKVKVIYFSSSKEGEIEVNPKDGFEIVKEYQE